jgi:flagellar hook-associated protein 1
MSSIGLNSGLKALLASQAALDVIGHNLSNANTPGYSRQRLEQSASPALQRRGLSIGAGVSADVVIRTTDALLQMRMVGQIASLSRLEASIGSMTEVQALLGEPGSFGLGGGMNEFFGAIAELSTSTEDLVLRTGMVQMTTAMTTQFNQLATTMRSLRQDTSAQVRIQVKQVNALTDRLVTLNSEIAQTEATGVPANDLRDQRDEAIRNLAGYVDLDFHEDPNGVIRITAGGRLLVGGNRSFAMSSETHEDGSVELFVEGSTAAVSLKQGTLAGLIYVGQDFIPSLQTQFDDLAGNLIFELNRAHSTGTPAAGHFQTLTSTYPILDGDLDGALTDELLRSSGLPFEIQSGEIYVNTTRLDTGELETHRLEINASTATVGDLLSSLNGISGLNANLNSFGRLQIFADAGFGFDFAPKLNPSPDKYGTMGGAEASLGTLASGPYVLADGNTLDLTGPSSSFTLTFDADDFVEVSQATAEELAAVINANADVQANGLRASVVGDTLYLQTAATGSAAGFSVDAGSSLGALGWTARTTVSGHDTAVEVEIGGAYTGTTNEHFVFVPRGDGVVGTTPDLEVDVFSSNGQLVATLDLGDSYQPGTVIDVAAGLTVQFGFGTLSASSNDSFQLDAIADSDTSDLLAAIGLNSLFVGTGASDIAIRSELEDNPQLISAGVTGAAGDNQALLAMMDLQSQAISGLDGESFGDYYGDVISGVGFDISTADTSRNVEEYLLQNLRQRREEVSGVNVDEEMVNMIRFEQSFGAASRYIQVLNDLTADLLRLI